jgi:hypothetical protein
VRNDSSTNWWSAVSTLAHCVPLPTPPSTLAAHARAIVGAAAVPRYPSATAPVETRIIVDPTRRARRIWIAEPMAMPTPQLARIAA